MEIDKSLTSDWTTNWNARLPIKITSVVLWGIAIIGLVISAVLLWDGEKELLTGVESDADRIAYQWSEFSREQQAVDAPIAFEFLQQLTTKQFTSVHLIYEGNKQSWGNLGKKDVCVSRRVTTSGIEQDIQFVLIELCHPPVGKSFRQQQKRWLWSMVAVCLVFGLVLSWTMNKVVTKPFEALVDGTRQVANGHLDYRFDASRPDEFGDLAQFFNEMVDNVAKQQEKLKAAVTDAEELARAKMDKLEESQSQLMALNSQMRNEISERKSAEQALLIAKQDAEMANQSKSVFLANMSHEIRTPMNAILGYAQILKRDHALEKEQRESINTIERSGQHLLQLINDILDISKIEAGKQKLNSADFDLKALTHDVDEMFRLRCQEKKLAWSVNDNFSVDDIHVYGDEGKVRQVLINLLGNAVKFTDSGAITLNIFRQAKTDRYRFEVCDTGEGIAESHQDSIFKAFQQSDQGVKKGGTGLGLAISSKQVDMMGGSLQIESRLSVGSKFYFEITLPKAENKVINIQEDDLKVVVKLLPEFSVNALVVDDVEVNRDLLSLILRKIGVNVTEAENGLVAIEKAKKSPPDIIFMDYRMPKMDGIEAMNQIRDIYGDKIKMVIVSATAFDHDREKFYDSACNGIITKPFKSQQVFSSMQKLLEIEYEYEDDLLGDVPVTSINGFDTSTIVLDPAIKMAINEAAEFCMITDLDVVIKQISELDGGQGLADHLAAMAKSYDMDGIIDIIGKISDV
ncbi:MAG: response regulator [Methylococcales bacterium]|jgi:signal transduction histidine kinase/CheY-like chemotaxis protein|nr:response regulator [Methylococcales bacterium]MBT7444894.1 response regulator [Methylococcales bacterium]